MPGYFWDANFPGLHPQAILSAAALTIFWLLLFRKLFYPAGRSGPGGKTRFRLRAASAAVLGALLFTPSIVSLQIPIQQAVSNLLMRSTTLTNQALIALPVIFLSGLIQEPVKLLAALLPAIRAERRDYLALGALAGAAYGGMEALLILSSAFHYPGLAAPVLAAALFERAVVIPFHLALTALAAHRFSTGTKQGFKALILAVLAHSLLLNYLAVFMAPLGGGLPVMLYITLVTLAAGWYLWKSVKADKEARLD
ncbi:MAG: hypothetical protein AB1767_09360 [Bacillota bacterium]